MNAQLEERLARRDELRAGRNAAPEVERVQSPWRDRARRALQIEIEVERFEPESEDDKDSERDNSHIAPLEGVRVGYHRYPRVRSIWSWWEIWAGAAISAGAVLQWIKVILP